jgi:hypothetical protein
MEKNEDNNGRNIAIRISISELLHFYLGFDNEIGKTQLVNLILIISLNLVPYSHFGSE